MLYVEIIDPCFKTNLTLLPSSIENFVAFAGYQVNSTKNYTFNDTESFTRTLPTDSEDFCGAKVLKFLINNTETLFLAAQNQDNITFSPAKGTKQVGVGQAQVIAVMNDTKYNTIES